MTDIADDLLDELGQLEEATSNLESETQKVKHSDDSSSQKPAEALDAANVALEAAKASQAAATESQKAADTALKLTNEQKSQVMELADANLSWRQTLRAANSEIKSARGSATVLMVFTISITLIAMSVMGWFYYNIQKKMEMYKGDILDLLKTDNKLFNKQMTLKVDQLSSLIEGMAMDVQTMAQAQLPPANFTAPPQDFADNDLIVPISPQETAHLEPEQMMPSEPYDQPASAMSHPDQQQAMHHQPLEPMALMGDKVPQPEMAHNGQHDQAPMAEMQPHPESSHQQPVNGEMLTHPEGNHQPAPMQQMPKAVAVAKVDTTAMETKLADIQKLVDEILKAQRQFEASTLIEAIQKLPKEENEKTAAIGLTAEQEKKLNGISWLVRQQDKLLKEIQKTVTAQQQSSSKVKTNTSTLPLKNIEKTLLELKNQVHSLQTQQNQIQKQVEDLQAETEKMAKDRPYSYRVK